METQVEKRVHMPRPSASHVRHIVLGRRTIRSNAKYKQVIQHGPTELLFFKVELAQVLPSIYTVIWIRHGLSTLLALFKSLSYEALCGLAPG